LARGLAGDSRRRPPIIIYGGKISFFGAEHEITPPLSIDVSGVAVRLIDGGAVLAEQPIFFIKSQQLNINIRNI